MYAEFFHLAVNRPATHTQQSGSTTFVATRLFQGCDDLLQLYLRIWANIVFVKIEIDGTNLLELGQIVPKASRDGFGFEVKVNDLRLSI